MNVNNEGNIQSQRQAQSLVFLKIRNKDELLHIIASVLYSNNLHNKFISDLKSWLGPISSHLSKQHKVQIR